MGPDDDLAKLLPEAPPRPERREAAIREALRRYDGEAPQPATPVRRPAFSWPRLNRPQFGAVMSMALLAVIGVPLALTVIRTEQGERGRPAPEKVRQPTAPSGRSPPASVENRETPEQAEGASTRERPPTTEATDQDKPAPAAPAASPRDAPTAADRLAARSPSVAGKATESGQDQEVVVTGARAEGQRFDSPTPVTAVGSEVIVTGSRSSRAAQRAAQRGDWNACTIEDPARRLDRCKREANPDAKGEKGRAAAIMAEGLALAWDGDAEGAIDAFDKAAQIAPKRSFIYLNRGLAYMQLGDTARALKEFDEAIRYAPYDARGYYHRSLAQRALGNERRAKADQERAISLDDRYAELFD